MCDNKNCYLSKSFNPDGEPVSGVTDCEHWVLELKNITVVDAPTSEAVQNIFKAVMEKNFLLSLPATENGSRVRINELYDHFICKSYV